MEYRDREQEKVTKTWAGEKAKLSQMTMSQKLEYIWTYYKIHIMVIVLIVAVIIAGIHHALTYVQYKFYGMVINSDQYNQLVMDDLDETLGLAKHEGVNITADLYTDEMSNMNGYGNRLNIYVMAGQLDFAFTDAEGAQYLADMGAVTDVSQVLPEELQSRWDDEDYLTYAVSDGEGGFQDVAIAVDISDSPIHDYFGLDDRTNYLVISGLSGTTEYMNNFLDLLYKIDIGDIKGE